MIFENVPLFRVRMLNDDVHSFYQVEQVLCAVFGKSMEEAKELANEVNNNGSTICGEYIFEIADSKICEVEALNKLNNMDLQVELVESDTSS